MIRVHMLVCENSWIIEMHGATIKLIDTDFVTRKRNGIFVTWSALFLTCLSINPNSPYIGSYHQINVMWKVRIPNRLLFWHEGSTCTAMNHFSQLCLGQFVAYIMYGKGCTKQVQHPLTIMSTWKEIKTGVHFLSRNLVVIMSQSSKVQCSVYGTRPFNIKITPLHPQCIYSFQVIILIHPPLLL
jgi:hypothetical protein